MAQEKNIGFLDSVKLFETTMDERFNAGDGENSILIVARDQDSSLIGSFGDIDGMAISLAHTCLQSEQLEYLVLKTTEYIIKNEPLHKILSFFMDQFNDNDDDDSD